MSARVTWLLPVKNGMPYLPAALESIAAQTFTDWEIIAWVNGSDDGTLEELRHWIPSRLPGRIVADRPGSYGRAMAEMTRMADTELCAIVHADDVNAPERLAVQTAFLDAHPEVAVAGGAYSVIDGEGRQISAAGHVYKRHDDIVNYMIQNTAIGCPTALFRRAAVLEAGNHRDIALVEDYDLWLRLAARHRLANVENCVLHYRVHERSATQEAVAADRVAPAANACFYAHASALYGLGERDAVRLRERRHPFALGPLLRAARHLSRTQGGTTLGRFFAPSFVAGGRGLVRPGDWLSRLPLTLLAYRRVSPGRIWSRLRKKLGR